MMLYQKRSLLTGTLVAASTQSWQDYLLTQKQLRNVAQKFIIFVDDLSFEEDDDAFKALKVVLEGSVTARSPNVVVYATSNRRHLTGLKQISSPNKAQSSFVSHEYVAVMVQPLNKTKRHRCTKCF